MKKVKLLLYCTKAKPYLYKHFKVDYLLSNTYEKLCINNGKIVAECDCDKVKKYSLFSNEVIEPYMWNDIQLKSKLNYIQLFKYTNYKDFYAIYLSNLKIYDKPRELNEYYKDNFLQELNITDTRVYKAPQNMCRVFDEKGNMYILLSIQPQWLCKILNGEKTIEVRKQIVKELKGYIENDSN